MTIKEAVELYNKNKKEIAELKHVQEKIVSDDSWFIKDPDGYYKTDLEIKSLFTNLLSEHIKRLETELAQEFNETDFECLKRIFTKAKLITAFDDYKGTFDNEIIVFLSGNELRLSFDKNTGEIYKVDDSQMKFR